MPEALTYNLEIKFEREREREGDIPSSPPYHGIVQSLEGSSYK